MSDVHPMKTFIALFRGINIGGHNMLPMKELAAILTDLGAVEVRTYIQSGNAVFRGNGLDPARFAEQLAAEVAKRRGFEPSVLVIEPDTLSRALAENPFPDAVSDPTKLAVGFLAARPEKQVAEKLSELRAGDERFHLGDRVLYLHLPHGAARSKLAAGAERALGVAMTARNWRTVGKLAEMANNLPGHPDAARTEQRPPSLPGRTGRGRDKP